MNNLKAYKMDGLGNDFVIFDNRIKSISLTKNQIIEIYKESKYRGAFRSKAYIYHLTYKDENSKVSTSKIIFIDKNISNKFEKALEKFGI